MNVGAAMILAVALMLPAAPSAQLAPPNMSGVSMGHLHYRVRDVAANKKFWIALGGRPLTIDGVDVIKFPGVLVVVTAGEPTGGTEGSVLNHVAFRVPSFTAVEAAGFSVARLQQFPGVGSVMTPEGERIELFEDAAKNLTFTIDAGHDSGPDAALTQRHNHPVGVPVAFHHVHLYVPDGEAPKAKAWYARMFGGVPGKRSQYEATDLPGINLNFSTAPRPTVPTKGRMLDHIGFEVKNLAAFCKKLEAMGVTFDLPYSRNRAGFTSAALTDPWGTSIELTEGLAELSTSAQATPTNRETHADLPGVRIWYKDSGGAGVPVVLLHAATGSSRVWEFQFPAFTARGYRVIAYDRRGFGRTVIDPAGVQPGTAADDLLALADHLRLDRFHLVGTAAGGFVAFDFALSFPQRLRSLVVANSIGGVQDEEYLELGRRLRPAQFNALPPDVRELSPSYRAANPRGTERWNELEHVSRPEGSAPVAQTFRNRVTFGALEGITTPTLLLTGDADLYAPPAILRMFTARMKKAESLIVREAGHSAYWEQPDIFNRAVLDFLRRH